jgi:hypothetical protein
MTGDTANPHMPPLSGGMRGFAVSMRFGEPLSRRCTARGGCDLAERLYLPQPNSHCSVGVKVKVADSADCEVIAQDPAPELDIAPLAKAD